MRTNKLVNVVCALCIFMALLLVQASLAQTPATFSTTLTLPQPDGGPTYTGKTTYHVQIATLVSGVLKNLQTAPIDFKVDQTTHNLAALTITSSGNKNVFDAAQGQLLFFHGWFDSDPEPGSYITVPGTPLAAATAGGAQQAAAAGPAREAKLFSVGARHSIHISLAALVTEKGTPPSPATDQKTPNITIRFFVDANPTGTDFLLPATADGISITDAASSASSNELTADLSSKPQSFSTVFAAAQNNKLYFTVSSDVTDETKSNTAVSKQFSTTSTAIDGSPYDAHERFPRALKITPDLFGAYVFLDPGSFNVVNGHIATQGARSTAMYGSAIVIHSVLGKLNFWGPSGDGFYGISLGIPILSSGTSSGTPGGFLTGLTAYLGDPDQRACAAITLGFAAQQVTRLSAGYHVGDAFTGTTPPTTQLWRGAFGFGVSFSVPLH